MFSPSNLNDAADQEHLYRRASTQSTTANAPINQYSTPCPISKAEIPLQTCECDEDHRRSTHFMPNRGLVRTTDGQHVMCWQGFNKVGVRMVGAPSGGWMNLVKAVQLQQICLRKASMLTRTSIQAVIQRSTMQLRRLTRIVCLPARMLVNRPEKCMKHRVIECSAPVHGNTRCRVLGRILSYHKR